MLVRTAAGTPEARPRIADSRLSYRGRLAGPSALRYLLSAICDLLFWSLRALHLQHRSQPRCAGTRGSDFGASPVTKPDAIKAVTVMNHMFDCLEVYYGLPSDLDKMT